jgi:hypothetical protein
MAGLTPEQLANARAALRRTATKSYHTPDGRIDREKVEDDLEAFIELWFDSIDPTDSDERYYEALGALETVRAFRRQRSERHGKGAGPARQQKVEAQRALATRIDREIVRKRWPHLVSINARAARIRESWPAATDVPLPGKSTIRRWLEKII